MIDNRPPREKRFIPLAGKELQAKVDEFLARLRTPNEEDYIAAVGELWLIEEDVRRYLEMGPAKRQAEYPSMFECNPEISAAETFKIRYLVLYSLSDDELDKIIKTLPECHARKDGFLNYAEKVKLVEELLIRYLTLCRDFYQITYLSIPWSTFIPEGNQYSVLRYHAYVEPEGWFSDSNIESYRQDLMQCRIDDLDKVAAGLELGEQKLIELLSSGTES